MCWISRGWNLMCGIWYWHSKFQPLCSCQIAAYARYLLFVLWHRSKNTFVCGISKVSCSAALFEVIRGLIICHQMNQSYFCSTIITKIMYVAMLFILQLTCTASWRINNLHRWANCANGMQHNGVGYVEISGIFVVQDGFSSEQNHLAELNQISLQSSSVRSCYHRRSCFLPQLTDHVTTNTGISPDELHDVLLNHKNCIAYRYYSKW